MNISRQSLRPSLIMADSAFSNYSINQFTNKSIIEPINYLINQLINQSINQLINQSINQPIYLCSSQDDMPLFTFILMGSLSFISVLGTAFLPETRNKVMEETTLKQNNGTTTEEERKSKDLEKNRLDLDLYPQRLPKFSGEKPTPSGHDAEKGVSNAAYSSTPESSRL